MGASNDFIFKQNNDLALKKDLTIGQKKHGSLEMRHIGNELYQNIAIAGSYSIKGGERYDSHSLNISGQIKRE